VCTVIAAEPIRRFKALRTDGSSSMTKMIGSDTYPSLSLKRPAESVNDLPRSPETTTILPTAWSSAPLVKP
jgi:hypothetical protein